MKGAGRKDVKAAEIIYRQFSGEGCSREGYVCPDRVIIIHGFSKVATFVETETKLKQFAKTH